MLRPRVIPEVFCVRQCVKQVDPETVLSKQIHDQQQVESRTVVSLFKLTWGMYVLYYYYYDPFFTQMTLMSYFKLSVKILSQVKVEEFRYSRSDLHHVAQRYW